MKMIPEISVVAAIHAIATTCGFAATSLTTSGDLSIPGNWSAGLPSSGNPGTISIDGAVSAGVTYTSFVFTQTAGEISQIGGGSNYSLSGGSFTQDGGVWRTGRGFVASNGNVTTLESGTILTSFTGTGGGTSNASFNGSQLIVNGGLFEVQSGRGFLATNGGTLTVNGGMFTIAGTVGDLGFQDAGGGVAFNGGTSSASSFNFSKGAVVSFGGSSAGVLNLDSFGTGATLDWSSGSLMELTIAGADQSFYEGLYSGGDLQFEGGNGDAFGDNFEVSGSTLSLVSVPEPSTFSLLSAVLSVTLLRRRRLA